MDCCFLVQQLKSSFVILPYVHLLLLIKELYLKEKELAAHHKKLGQVDSRYLKVAERLVCEEFAMVLQTTPESIKKRLHRGMLQ